jgi:hypothetical protein
MIRLAISSDLRRSTAQHAKGSNLEANRGTRPETGCVFTPKAAETAGDDRPLTVRPIRLHRAHSFEVSTALSRRTVWRSGACHELVACHATLAE